MSPRPKTPNPLPQSTAELAKQLQREGKKAGSLLDSIDLRLKDLRRSVEKSAKNATSFPTSSVIGSEIQSFNTTPMSERNFDYLEQVDETLEKLVGEAP